MRFLVGVPGLTLYPPRSAQTWWRNITTEELTAVAQKSDELGIDFINVSTHFVMHKDWVGNMGSRWPHSLAATGFLLGATRQIKVFCKTVVPCHNPIELAKALATLDFMSGGRVIPVPIVGYMDWEFDLLKVPFNTRGAMMDEYMEAIIELWTAEYPSFEGQYVNFRDITFEPKPTQRPMPLWFGGRANAALRRIARFGDGWISYATPHAAIPAMVDYIRRQPAFQERPRPLEVYANLVERTRDPYTHREVTPPEPLVGKDAILERVGALAATGVTITTVPVDQSGSKPGMHGPVTGVGDYLERLDWFAQEILPHARDI